MPGRDPGSARGPREGKATAERAAASRESELTALVEAEAEGRRFAEAVAARIQANLGDAEASTEMTTNKNNDR